MEHGFRIEDVRAFWDSAARIYESSNAKFGYIHTQRYEKALEFAQLKPEIRILNIWSRTGNLIPYLRRTHGLTIHNREASPRMMAIAKQHFPEEEFSLTDLEDLSEFPDNYFDRVISLETLEHVPKPSIFMQELSRILKPGGILVMSTPPRGAELSVQIFELFFTNHGEGPHRFPWPHEVKEMLADANLTLLKHRPYVILPLGIDRLTRLSEKILTGIFGKTPLANMGYRHFYIAKK